MTRVWGPLRQVCHEKLKVLIHQHTKTRVHISGIALSPFRSTIKSELRIRNLRNRSAAASRSPHHQVGRHLGFTLYLHSETDQQIFEDSFTCAVLVGVEFRFVRVPTSVNWRGTLSQLTVDGM